MKKLLLLISISFFVGISHAQKINTNKYKTTPEDKQVWEELQSVKKSNSPDEASALAGKLIKKLEKGKDPQGNLRMMNDLAMWYMENRMYPEGKQLIDTLFNIYPEKYDTLNIDYSYLHSNLAYFHHIHDRYGQRLKHQKIQTDIIKKIDSHHPLLVELYTEIAGAYFARRKIEEGFSTAEKALEIARAEGHHYYIALNYMNMANIIKFYEPYMALDFMDFTAYYAMNYQKEYYANDPYYYINRGACYVAVDASKQAIKQFKKGLEVLRSKEKPDVNFETAFYYYLGVCYKNLGEYDKASEYYKKGAEIYSKLFSKNHKRYLRNIAITSRNLILAGKHEKALPTLREIYPLIIKNYGFDNTYFTVQAGTDLGEALLETGHYDDALAQYHQNINFFYGDSITGNPYKLPKIDSTGKGMDRTSLFLSYLGKAKALAKLYNQNPSDSLLENILAHYQTCAEVSDITAYHGPIDDNDARIIAYQLRKLTNTSLDFASTHNLSEENLQILYKTISKNKAYSLLGSIHKKKKGFYGNNSFLQEKEDKVHQLEIKMKNQNYPDSGKVYEQDYKRLLDLKKEIFIYKQNNPTKKQNINIEKVESVVDKPVNTNLKDNEAVMDIYLTDNNLVIFSIDNKNFDFYTYPLSGKLKENSLALKRAIKTAGNYQKTARQLYKLLVADIKEDYKQKENLVIIPDGILYTIPFEVFMDKNNKYLIEDHSITYRYTSHLYKNNKESLDNKSFFGMAPVFESDNYKLKTNNPLRNATTDSLDILRGGSSQLESLPYSKNETITLTEILNDNNWKTTLLLNDKATEKAFKTLAPEHSIIHLATHGYVDPKKPENSGLFLSQNESSHNEDNYLFMSELFNLDINADLVVLSACKSGYGKVWKGEGILALPRAFLAGGTRNVVSALWGVHDEKTMELMLNFYNELQKESDYAEALQRAKIKMINDGEMIMDWSGFTLIQN